MSLIALSAPLIRLAAIDDGYARDLFEAVDSDEESRAGLVRGRIGEDELDRLTPTEWQWYANWRQALGGSLDRRLLNHLAASVATRFARFEVRALVLRDPPTNQLAPEYDSPPGEETDDTIGLHWLSEQAAGRGVDDTFRPADTYWRIVDYEDRSGQAGRAADDEAPQDPARYLVDDEPYSLRRRRAYNEDALELVTDALQCGTDASWFLLRRLVSPDGGPSSPLASQRRDLVMDQIAAFAAERILNSRWYERGEPLR